MNQMKEARRGLADVLFGPCDRDASGLVGSWIRTQQSAEEPALLRLVWCF
jgi:hypothetical protein